MKPLKQEVPKPMKPVFWRYFVPQLVKQAKVVVLKFVQSALFLK
jgi:hypothetical protein